MKLSGLTSVLRKRCAEFWAGGKIDSAMYYQRDKIGVQCNMQPVQCRAFLRFDLRSGEAPQYL